MGLLALPAMLRAGYDVKLSAGAITAGGCLGILIPPSVMLILYGATAGVSVVKLYAGAFLPGVMLAGLYVVYVIVRAVINPKIAPKLPAKDYDVPFFTVFKMLLTSFFPLDDPDPRRARQHRVRPGDALRGGGDRLARRTDARRRLPPAHLGAA